MSADISPVTEKDISALQLGKGNCGERAGFELHDKTLETGP